MIFKLLFFLGILAVLIFTIPSVITRQFSKNRIHDIDDSPTEKAAIVFGAGLLRDGTPTAVLRDRVATAVELYKAGKVEKLLMSGDNRFEDYNEPAAMLEYATQLGIPEEDIVLDFAGRSTYDTCYRAKYIFGVDQALLITQRYHLPRALYTCNKLGLEASGVSADRREYRKYAYRFWVIREFAATTAAFWDLWIEKPLPVMGNLEPIFKDGPSAVNGQTDQE